MARRVRDYIGISESTSLDDLIRYLEAIRDNLPDGHEAEMRIRGDERTGRQLTIAYVREQTSAESALDRDDLAANPDAAPGDADIDQLRRLLDGIPYGRSGRGRER